MIIGVTGKSGSGKNWFSECLCKVNPELVHIDVDKIGHAAFEIPEVKEKLVAKFGAEILLPDGQINRKHVADLVFTNRHNYAQMAEITWVHMQRLLDEAIADTSKDYILNWILLPHSKYFELCDIKYLVKRDEDLRIEGVLARDGITLKDLAERDANGISYDESEYDFIVLNNKER